MKWRCWRSNNKRCRFRLLRLKRKLRLRLFKWLRLRRICKLRLRPRWRRCSNIRHRRRRTTTMALLLVPDRPTLLVMRPTTALPCKPTIAPRRSDRCTVRARRVRVYRCKGFSIRIQACRQCPRWDTRTLVCRCKGCNNNNSSIQALGRCRWEVIRRRVWRCTLCNTRIRAYRR